MRGLVLKQNDAFENRLLDLRARVSSALEARGGQTKAWGPNTARKHETKCIGLKRGTTQMYFR